MNNKEGTIFSDIFDSYRVAIIHSIVTTFGLDFIVRDHYGGDVDTINNVRKGIYQKESNRQAYLNRGEYDSKLYHNQETYSEMIREVRNKGFFDDAYSPGNRIAYGKQSALKHNTTSKANLDHMLSAKSIHDDPGRVLAGQDGPNLANQRSNLYFTNEKLNKSLSDSDKLEYIQRQREKGTPLTDKEEAAIKKNYYDSKFAYDCKLRDYYQSPVFLNDCFVAANRVGVAMGIRQLFGFIFIEIWVACENEIKALPPRSGLGDCLSAIRRGINKGIEDVKKNYKQLLSQFGQGYVAGLLSSLGTTLLNIFVTTNITQIKVIRQLFITGVQASNILLFNPSNDLLGNQIKKAAIAIITGASGVVGIIVGRAIGKYLSALLPQLRGIISTFISVLVSALLSCTILVLIDRSKLIALIIAKLNEYGSLAADLKRQIQEFDRISLEISNLDIDDFESKISSFNEIANLLSNSNEGDINKILHDYYKKENLPLPWEGDFDEFMSNRNNHLKFE